MRLRLIAALACCMPAAGNAEADAAPVRVSSHAMVHTCCTPPAMQESIFAEARASGAEFIRVDIELGGIFTAPEAAPDWRGLDRIIELARRHDLRVLGLILSVPAYLSSCPERGETAPLCPPTDPAEFGRLAGEVAAHAGGSIGHWEILNEPDADWAFKGTPEDYARMLSASYESIKTRVPEAQVLMGGVERPGEGRWIERMLATPGARAIRRFDIANIHARGKLTDLPRYVRGWRARLAAHGFRGPLWVTEHGYPADPAVQRDPAHQSADASQASYLSLSVPTLARAGARQVFVTLRDNLWGEYLSEGLVYIDVHQPHYPAARRVAFDAVRGLAGLGPAEPPPPPPAPVAPQEQPPPATLGGTLRALAELIRGWALQGG